MIIEGVCGVQQEGSAQPIRMRTGVASPATNSL